MSNYGNLIIVAATCLISWYGLSHSRFVDDWILNPSAANRNKQYYRYISYGFVHADIPHLIFNMITLFFFGRAMEGFFAPHFGGFGYFVFYFGALVCSILPTAISQKNNPRYSTLGASGAVSAVLFSFILLQPWSLIYIYFIPVPAILYGVGYFAYTFYMDKKGTDSVNHSAHLWGSVYGVSVTVLLEPTAVTGFFSRLARFGA
ncbi:MAG: rhomboid family intramembrane serine protease [Arenimonas sp.]|nr:rhomboid family intramembrane serine protease [Arenimonas sp.]